MGNVNRGYIIPEEPLPTDDYCLTVYIPKNTDYLIQFFTALGYFGKWNSWKRVGGNLEKDVADRWKVSIEKTHDAWAEGGCMAGIRINPETCLMEVNCGNTEIPDWRVVLTEDYRGSIDGSSTPLYPDAPPEGQSNECLAAANTTAMLENGATNFTNLLVTTGLFGTVVSYLYSLLATMLSVTLSDLWSGVSAAWAEFDAGTIEADLAAFDWDVLKNILVCLFDGTGTMTGENWAIAHDQIHAFAVADTNQIWNFIDMVWSLMGQNGATLSTRWANIVDADCDGCPWEYTFDFATTNGGFSGSVGGPCDPYAVYSAGVGWQGIFGCGGYGYHELQIVRNITSAYITHVEIEYTYTGVNGSNSHQIIGGSSYALPYDPNTNLTQIRIAVASDTQSDPPDKQITVTSLTIRGEGFNPFV